MSSKIIGNINCKSLNIISNNLDELARKVADFSINLEQTKDIVLNYKLHYTKKELKERFEQSINDQLICLSNDSYIIKVIVDTIRD
jgi:hypothetical protein